MAEEDKVPSITQLLVRIEELEQQLKTKDVQIDVLEAKLLEASPKKVHKPQVIPQPAPPSLSDYVFPAELNPTMVRSTDVQKCMNVLLKDDASLRVLHVERAKGGTNAKVMLHGRCMRTNGVRKEVFYATNYLIRFCAKKEELQILHYWADTRTFQCQETHGTAVKNMTIASTCVDVEEMCRWLASHIVIGTFLTLPVKTGTKKYDTAIHLDTWRWEEGCEKSD